MPVSVQCTQCGTTYELKDEFAGKSVKCPQCDTVNVVPKPVGGGDPAFDRDKFLLRQKVLSIKEKYYVWDEGGEVILYVERPIHFLKGLLAMIAGLAAGAVVFMGFALVAPSGDGPAAGAVALFGMLAAFVAFLAVAIRLSPKRHVTFYRDDTMKERVLEVIQDQRWAPITATFTIRDPQAKVLARLKKNYLYNIFRKQWQCRSPGGTMIAVAKEDSIILSLLRRLLGPFFGLLRTNFIILRGVSDSVVGEFNRKATLLDRYVLDMSRDPRRMLDRRIMLALGVMLDTGERR